MAPQGQNAFVIRYSSGGSTHESVGRIGGKIHFERDSPGKASIDSFETTEPFVRVMVTTVGADGKRARSMFYVAGLDAPVESVTPRSPPLPIALFDHETMVVVHTSGCAHRLLELDEAGATIRAKTIPENGACAAAPDPLARALRIEVADCDIYRLSGYRTEMTLELRETSLRFPLPPAVREQELYVVDVPLSPADGESRYLIVNADEADTERMLEEARYLSPAPSDDAGLEQYAQPLYTQDDDDRIEEQDKLRDLYFGPRVVDEPGSDPEPAPRSRVRARSPAEEPPAKRANLGDRQELLDDLRDFLGWSTRSTLGIDPPPAKVELPRVIRETAVPAEFVPPINPDELHKYTLKGLRAFLKDHAPHIVGRTSAARPELERMVRLAVAELRAKHRESVRKEALESARLASLPRTETPPRYDIDVIPSPRSKVSPPYMGRQYTIRKFVEDEGINDPAINEYLRRPRVDTASRCEACKRHCHEFSRVTAIPCGHASVCKECLGAGLGVPGSECPACNEEIATNVVFRE